MKVRKVLFGLMYAVLLVGCASFIQPVATVENGVVSNPSLGFFGFSFEVPEGFDLYTLASEPPSGELQQLAVRILNLNRDYHPRGNEMFYDSLLMLSDKTAVILMMIKVSDVPIMDTTFFEEAPIQQAAPVFPLYNISGQATVPLSQARTSALCTRGSAYEQNGWHYADPRRGRILFQYEAAEASGSSRDRYILLGICLPGNEDTLRLQMQEMVQALSF